MIVEDGVIQNIHQQHPITYLPHRTVDSSSQSSTVSYPDDVADASSSSVDLNEQTEEVTRVPIRAYEEDDTAIVVLDEDSSNILPGYSNCMCSVMLQLHSKIQINSVD